MAVAASYARVKHMLQVGNGEKPIGKKHRSVAQEAEALLDGLEEAEKVVDAA